MCRRDGALMTIVPSEAAEHVWNFSSGCYGFFKLDHSAMEWSENTQFWHDFQVHFDRFVGHSAAFKVRWQFWLGFQSSSRPTPTQPNTLLSTV